MNPWKTLNIDPTDDKKTIKKAYAKLIKQYKPDENPEKFQEIQEAYQYAQSLIQSDIQNNINNVESEKSQNNNIFQSDVIESISEKSEEQFIANEIKSNLEHLLNQPQETIDTISNWMVFRKYKNIDDIELKNHISLNVFKLIAEFNLENLNNKKLPHINIYNIQFLDKIFNWSDNWREFETIFPPEYLQVTLLIPEQIVIPENHETPIIARGIALYLDYMVAIFLAFLYKSFSLNVYPIGYNEQYYSILLISIITFYRVLLESLIPTHRSIGKMIKELFIIQNMNQYCSFKKSLIRHLVLLIYISPFIINNYIQKIDMLYLLSFYIIIIVINIICITYKGKLLHDILSKSTVIEIISS